MKRIIFLLASLFFLIGGKVQCQETYKIGNTEYYNGKKYSTTGKPMVKRSETNKNEFLKSKGYNKVPKGYQVDHIKPLSEGGTDDPSNMQLISTEQHKRKTATESKNRSNSTLNSYPQYKSSSTSNSYPKYKSNSTYKSQNYSAPSSTYKSIQTGSRGGKYYINSNGNKTYVKKK